MRNLDLGLFYIVAVSGVSIIGYIMAGWASDNKYALLGAVRSAAQLISYEIPLILAVLATAMVAGTLDLEAITLQQTTHAEHLPAAAAVLHHPDGAAGRALAPSLRHPDRRV